MRDRERRGEEKEKGEGRRRLSGTFMNAYFVLLLYVAFLVQKVTFPAIFPPSLE